MIGGVSKTFSDLLSFTILFLIGILGSLYFIARYCNKIDITPDELVITNFIGKQYRYPKNKHTVSIIGVARHTVNNADMCYTLSIALSCSDEKVTWRLSGYPEKVLNQIIAELDVKS